MDGVGEHRRGVGLDGREEVGRGLALNGKDKVEVCEESLLIVRTVADETDVGAEMSSGCKRNCRDFVGDWLRPKSSRTER